MRVRGATWIGGLCGLACSLAIAQAPTPTNWVITLAWSPEYCKVNIGSDEPQCQQAHYFELGGLAPHFAPGTPEAECQDGQLPQEVLARGLQAMPNKAQLRKTWRKDGACSGLAAAEYVMQLERAGRRLTIPEEYRRLDDAPLKTTVGALKLAFVHDNPGLAPEYLMTRCRSGGWLAELKICVDGEFNFAPCPAEVGEICPANLRLRPLRPALRPSTRAEPVP